MPIRDVVPVVDINETPPRIKKVPYSGRDRGKFRWDDRPAKDALRHIIARTTENKRNLLVMPGSLGRDIQLLKYYGSAKPGAEWTIVERDLDQYGLLLRQELFHPTDRVVPHLNDFALLKTTDYDFAWFDLLGNLSLHHLHWFHDRFVPSPDLDLVFGFMEGGRGAKTTAFTVLKNTLNYSFPQEMRSLQNKLEPASPKHGRAKTRTETMDKNVVTHLAAFDYMFSGWDYDVELYVYSDTVPFLAYRLNNFRKSQQEAPLARSVDKVLQFLAHVSAGLTDEDIADETAMTIKQVRVWKEVNKLSHKVIQNYEMAEGFGTLLTTQEIPHCDRPECINALGDALAEFNPYFVETGGYFTQTKKGIRITTERARYTIEIGSSISYSEHPLKATITPTFLHPSNHNALHSVFRCLFRGDEELHPQLSSYAYYDEGGAKFILSEPQMGSIMAYKASYLSGENAGAIVLPTGMGKTVVATQIVDWMAQQVEGFRFLFLADKNQILEQSIDSMKRQTLFEYDSDYCRFYGNYPKTQECLDKPCVFASVASLSDPKYLRTLLDEHFDLVVVDEAHHINATTWSRVADHFRSHAYLLGLTATPFRGDNLLPLEKFDNNLLSAKNLNRGIWEGYLSWPDYRIFDDRTDYKRQLGVMDAKIMREIRRSDGYLSIILGTYQKVTPGAKALVFVNSTKTARIASDYFNRHGVSSDVIVSETAGTENKRKQILKRFKNRQTQVLFSVGMMNEGVDVADLEVIIKLNTTQSPVKSVQQLGRGLRLYPGKRNVIVLDFTGNFEDLNALFNLGIYKHLTPAATKKISRKRMRGLTSAMLSDESLPAIPSINYHIVGSARLVIKNIIDKALTEEVSRDRQREIWEWCQEGYLPGDMVRLKKSPGYGLKERTIREICDDVSYGSTVTLVWRLRVGVHVNDTLGGSLAAIPMPDLAQISGLEEQELLKLHKDVMTPKRFKQNIDVLLGAGDTLEQIADKLAITMKKLEELLSR